MRHHAFTVIELIFVILVLGGLTATAVAKMGGMADHTKEIQLKAFNGTLNRTSGAGLWSRSLENDRNGSIAYAVPGFTSGPSLENCNADGNGVFLSYLFSVHYEIRCKDGNRHEGPKFRLYRVDTDEYLD
jgi:type II secretory pathway pseudopilin PulG